MQHCSTLCNSPQLVFCHLLALSSGNQVQPHARPISAAPTWRVVCHRYWCRLHSQATGTWTTKILYNLYSLTSGRHTTSNCTCCYPCGAAGKMPKDQSRLVGAQWASSADVGISDSDVVMGNAKVIPDVIDRVTDNAAITLRFGEDQVRGAWWWGDDWSQSDQ
jgi:hypothetical protein